MIKIKYRFLIFILFLSPLVQAVDAVCNNYREPSVIVAPNCHDSMQTNHDNISMDCECEDCYCGCIYNNVTVLDSYKAESFLSNNTHVVLFNIVIPFQKSHPPFRPPII